MARVFSGIQPTGDIHLGNWIGAISRWAREQQPEHTFCIVDLHAITLPIDPGFLRERTIDLAAWLLAAGLDPEVCTLFVQSHLTEHPGAAWVLSCTAGMGELQRMTQFKEKTEGRERVPVGLFTYPVLQAADILLHHADEVPVGEDQRQHIELTRDLAERFNGTYGQTFTLPKATLPKAGARIMDLQRPDKKMSKSSESPAGTVLLAEDPTATAKKFQRAVTDSGSEVRSGPDKAGVTNLLDLLSAVTGRTLPDLEAEFGDAGYGTFKKVVAEAVNDFLAPARARHAELSANPGQIGEALRVGAQKARAVASRTMADVREKVGFLPG